MDKDAIIQALRNGNGAESLALLAGGADDFMRKPFGYNNPPGDFVSDLIGLPAVANVAGKVSQNKPVEFMEALEAGLAGAPLVGPAAKGIKGVAGLAKYVR